MQRTFPILQWLPTYKKRWFTKDLVAGLTVGILLVPQGMAYAMIAGMPPVYGLYAALVPILAYALLGTSRQLAIGPVAMDSLLVAAGLATLALTGVENYIAMALLLAFMVGVVQFLLGLLRMGFLVRFISRPVISGFTSAAAIIIIFSQLKHFFGVQIPASGQFHKSVANVFLAIPETNGYDLIIGIVGIVLILILKRWNKRIPAILIVVILGIIAVNAFGLDKHGVHIVGEVPGGLPSFSLPRVQLAQVQRAFFYGHSPCFNRVYRSHWYRKGNRGKKKYGNHRPEQRIVGSRRCQYNGFIISIVSSFGQFFPLRYQ